MLLFVDVFMMTFILFRSTTDAGCVGQYNAPEGTISTPNFPYFIYYYPNRISFCEWQITVNRNDKIFLTSNDYSRMYSYTYRYIEVRDGFGSLAPRLRFYQQQSHGNTITLKWKSSSYAIYVKFYTHGMFSRFSAGWTVDDVTSDCGRNYTEKDGVIYSPAYPGYFMGLDQCEWRITVPIQYRIFLKSTYFYVYRDPDHRGSKIGVEVRDVKWNITLTVFFGEDAIQFSTGSHMLSLTLLNELNARFRIEWTSVPVPTTEAVPTEKTPWPIIGGVIGCILLIVLAGICVYVRCGEKILKQLHVTNENRSCVAASNDNTASVPRQVHLDDANISSDSCDTLPRQPNQVNTNLSRFIVSLRPTIQSPINAGPNVPSVIPHNNNQPVTLPPGNDVSSRMLPSTSNGTVRNPNTHRDAPQPSRQQRIPSNGRRVSASDIYVLPGAIPMPPPYSQIARCPQAPPDSQAPPSYIPSQRPPSYTSTRRLPRYTSERQSNHTVRNGSRNVPTAQYGRPPPSYASVWQRELSGSSMEVNTGCDSESQDRVFSPPPAYSRHTYQEHCLDF